MFILNVDHDGKMAPKTHASTWWCYMLGALCAHRDTVLLIHITCSFLMLASIMSKVDTLTSHSKAHTHVHSTYTHPFAVKHWFVCGYSVTLNKAHTIMHLTVRCSCGDTQVYVLNNACMSMVIAGQSNKPFLCGASMMFFFITNPSLNNVALPGISTCCERQRNHDKDI